MAETTPERNASNSGTREELGCLLREAARLLEETDLRGANEALKKATTLPAFANGKAGPVNSGNKRTRSHGTTSRTRVSVISPERKSS